MARQKGNSKLHGKVGNMVYYKTRRYGMIAREIGIVPKELREVSASYEKPKKNNDEFGYGSRVGKLIRKGVKECFPDGEEGSTNSNLAGLIKKALAADTDNPHGQRRLTSENVALLKGFNWAERVRVGNVIKKGYLITLEAEQGHAVLDIDLLRPRVHVKAGAGATHVQVRLVLVGVDYEGDKQRAVCAESDMIDLGMGEAISINLSCSLNECAYPLVVAGIGVQGYQESNRVMVEMQDRCVFEIGEVWAE